MLASVATIVLLSPLLIVPEGIEMVAVTSTEYPLTNF